MTGGNAFHIQKRIRFCEPDYQESVEKIIKEILYGKSSKEIIDKNLDEIKNQYLLKFPNENKNEGKFYCLKSFIKNELDKFVGELEIFGENKIPSKNEINTRNDKNIALEFFYKENTGLKTRINNLINKLKIFSGEKFNNDVRNNISENYDKN